MKVVYRLIAKYPKKKQTEHAGDSFVLYESGNRTTEYPTDEAFKDLVKETEGGDEVDSDVIFHTNLNLLKRGGSYPGQKMGERNYKKITELDGYPREETFFQKILSRYGKS